MRPSYLCNKITFSNSYSCVKIDEISQIFVSNGPVNNNIGSDDGWELNRRQAMN